MSSRTRLLTILKVTGMSECQACDARSGLGLDVHICALVKGHDPPHVCRWCRTDEGRRVTFETTEQTDTEDGWDE